MAYIVFLEDNKGRGEYLALWSSLLEAEIEFIKKSNSSLNLSSYQIIKDNPTEDECLNLPRQLNNQYKTDLRIRYLLPTDYSSNVR